MTSEREARGASGLPETVSDDALERAAGGGGPQIANVRHPSGGSVTTNTGSVTSPGSGGTPPPAG